MAAEAVVAYQVVGLGMGVRFWWISLEDRQRIANYVEYSQPQEQSAEQAP